MPLMGFPNAGKVTAKGQKLERESKSSQINRIYNKLNVLQSFSSNLAVLAGNRRALHLIFRPLENCQRPHPHFRAIDSEKRNCDHITNGRLAVLLTAG